MKLAKTVLTALAALTLPAAAQAVVIDFDDLGNGVVVTNQYAGVTFSSDPGFEVLTTAQSLGSSTPNFICACAGFPATMCWCTPGNRCRDSSPSSSAYRP